MELTNQESLEVKRIYELFYAQAIPAEQALEDLELLIYGEESNKRTCVGLDCGERLDKDIWIEESGMCIECSNAYYTHEEDEKGDN